MAAVCKRERVTPGRERRRRGTGEAIGITMRKSVFCILLLFSAIFPICGKGQVFYANFQGSMIPYVSYDGGCTFVPQAPRAQHDSRIDPRLERAARIAERNAFSHTTYRCWRYVKTALVTAGAVAGYPSTSYACDAGRELTARYGFVRLPIHDPYRAPVGAVLVYEGGGAGHVEIRTEHGFASDYRSEWACKYRLIGVYAKLST